MFVHATPVLDVATLLLRRLARMARALFSSTLVDSSEYTITSSTGPEGAGADGGPPAGTGTAAGADASADSGAGTPSGANEGVETGRGGWDGNSVGGGGGGGGR